MQSPLPTLALCLFYAFFSKSLAPRLMENRKPMDLRKTLVFYNLFQTIFSTWIFYEVSSSDDAHIFLHCSQGDFKCDLFHKRKNRKLTKV